MFPTSSAAILLYAGKGCVEYYLLLGPKLPWMHKISGLQCIASFPRLGFHEPAPTSPLATSKYSKFPDTAIT